MKTRRAKLVPTIPNCLLWDGCFQHHSVSALDNLWFCLVLRTRKHIHVYLFLKTFTVLLALTIIIQSAGVSGILALLLFCHLVPCVNVDRTQFQSFHGFVSRKILLDLVFNCFLP